MRGFSDEERDRIREELIRTGRELFLQYGPDKTNVSDVTEPVGIAKSTFYRFFDSKSELYLVIFLRERDAFLDQLRSELSEVEDAETGIVLLFDIYLSWLEDSSMLQGLISQWNHDAALQNVSETTLQSHKQEALAAIIPFIDEWQKRGDMQNIDHEVFFGLMGAIGLITARKAEFDDFQDGMYETVRNVMIESLASGLTTRDKD